ncbi:hypothetical protein D0Z07_0955 [Hyphodiscus hymeniophilus]|uniref:Uncharacterized protein n=1 Tax=Hyphodiscus hymeniophilus TaxID=353542 RepID=A0A9P6VRH3_9HELO|nr:hypothetical protein D0Z07_0955 [Hyphodiscus hymeniophilus]
MPHPVIGPMEHPVAGLATRRKVAATQLVHGDTSLKPSDASPLLEAHPGSPVDFSRQRPSLAASLSSTRSDGSIRDPRSPRSPRLEGNIEDVRRGGVAAKENASVGEDREENHEMKPPHRRMQVTAVQPFYIPAKVPEEIQVQTTPVPGDDRMSVDTAMEESLMDFDFETDNGVWISAHPIASSSRTSLATTTTASTLIDDRYSHGALTIDTSIASSATSMISSSAVSFQSAASSDIYGWEEELDRKASIERYNVWEQEMARRLPSGGTILGPRARDGIQDFQYKRGGEGRRRSLLHRVLNLSGKRVSEDPGTGISSISSPSSADYPTTPA